MPSFSCSWKGLCNHGFKPFALWTRNPASWGRWFPVREWQSCELGSSAVWSSASYLSFCLTTLSPYASFILSIKAGKFSSHCMKCVEWDVLNGNEMCFILVAGALFSICEQGNKVTLISQLGSFSLLKLRWSSGWWHYPVWHCDGRHMILHTCQNP